jgi:hypothetical protein
MLREEKCRVYRSTVFGTHFYQSSSLRQAGHLLSLDLSRGFVAMTPYHPMIVVCFLKFQQGKV